MTLDVGSVRMDVERHVVSVNGQSLKLPLKEFELLEILLRNAGRVLTRMQLIDRVWGSDYVGDTKTLDVHIKRLRAKVEPDPAHPRHIVTLRGSGLQVRALSHALRPSRPESLSVAPARLHASPETADQEQIHDARLGIRHVIVARWHHQYLEVRVASVGEVQRKTSPRSGRNAEVDDSGNCSRVAADVDRLTRGDVDRTSRHQDVLAVQRRTGEYLAVLGVVDDRQEQRSSFSVRHHDCIAHGDVRLGVRGAGGNVDVPSINRVVVLRGRGIAAGLASGEGDHCEGYPREHAR